MYQNKYYTAILLLLICLWNASCANLYYTTNNPLKAQAVSLPTAMYGTYKGTAEDYLVITANELQVHYNNGGHLYSYEGNYGPNTKYPVYQVGDAYMISYIDEEYPNYYRIFLFDYDPQKQEIHVQELYGKKNKEEKQELIRKQKQVRLLSNPEHEDKPELGADYLFDPTPQQLRQLIANNAFETVATFAKKGVICDRVKTELYCSSYDNWSRCNPDKMDQEWAAKVKEYINYFARQKKTGSYEFSIQEDGQSFFYMVKVNCAD